MLNDCIEPEPTVCNKDTGLKQECKNGHEATFLLYEVEVSLINGVLYSGIVERAYIFA